MTIQQHASFDSSAAELNATSKLVKAWESKNARNAAKAGGISLMALSLAACGGSSTPVADAPVVADPVVPDEPVVTPVGKALVYTDSATADVLVGGDNNDTFTAASGTYADTDSATDSSTTDADVANIVVKAASAPDLTNIETITISVESTATGAINFANITGASTVNVSKDDITIGGSVISASPVVELDNVDSANAATINVTGTVTTVDIDAASTDKAGVVLNAETASSGVTVDGAATINANSATGTVAINAVSNTTAAETGKASVINAAKATTVTTHADLTGSIEINAAAATTVTVADAQGGVTINAAKGATTANGIDVRGIDASGATITTGTYASTAAGTIDIAGTAKTTDVATISAAGSINLDAGVASNSVDVLNLNANGAAVTYTVTVGNGALTSTVLGDDVTAKGNEAVFAGTTVTGTGTLDLSAGTADAVDLSLVDVAKIKIGFDNDNNPGAPDHQFTVKSGQTIELYKDQADFDVDFATGEAAGDLTLIAGDDNGALNTAVGTITTGVLDLAAGATVAGTVTIEASAANLTATTSTTLGAKQDLVITGDEDVTLGAVTAKSVNASASTGKIDLSSTTGVKSITTGSGADAVTVNGAAKHVVATNGGKDTITITNTAAEASFDAGAGDDTINANKAGVAYVVVAGDGNDTITTTGDIDVVVAGGEGTDTFDANNNGAFDASNNTSFNLASIEKVDITGVNDTFTVSAAQFAAFNTAELTGDAAADVFKVTAAATGSTIDASGLTVKSGGTVTIQYLGGAKADTITGGVAAETFLHSLGGDSIEGGATGIDTFSIADSTVTESGSTNASTGAVINISGSAVSGTTVFAGLSKYTGNNADVAAGSVSYNYAANVATNSSLATNLGGIENVIGGDGTDYIIGSAGDNDLNGGGAGDYITGGDGDDTITGAGGNDTLVGGNGADTFVIADGIDTVSDYTKADDFIKIDLSGVEATTADGSNAVNLIEADLDGGNVAANDTGVGLVVTAALDLDTVTDGTNVLIIDDTLADEAALETALASGGTAALTLGADLVNDAGILVIFSNGTDAFLTLVSNTSGSTILDGDTLTTGELDTDILVTFKGVADGDEFANANISAFIA